MLGCPQCKSPYVVAEGCCNHMGDLELAKEMTRVAKLCGSDYIKWQKRDPHESVPKEWQTRPHPNPAHAFGETYLEHRLNLEFSTEQHQELRDYAKEMGIGYAVSVWDETSAAAMISLAPSFIKIPSAANLNFDLLNFVVSNYSGDIHLSLGMTDHKQRERILSYVSASFVELGHDRFVIYHTTTEYPCAFEHLYLREIGRLKNKFNTVGYSGHNYGIAADIAAITLGADWVERHFTLDRTFKGGDHSASLEPDGLRKLCRDVKNVYKALEYKPDDMTEEEQTQSKKLRAKIS